MKMIGLDIGDVWTGIALSDALGMFAQPHSTVATKELLQKLVELIKQEQVKTVVVGYPKTMRGTESEQTKKIISLKEMLKKQLTDVTWVLWDERLSSKRAQMLKKTRTKKEKLHSHAIAASFILDSYLTYLRMYNNS